jgi:long-chain fatty acid transport protein
VAKTYGADTSYFNPANMVWLEDGNFIEGSLEVGILPSYTYNGKTKLPIDSSGAMYPNHEEGEDETAFIPSFHYVSPFVDNVRFGLSFVAPAGLAKRWHTYFGESYAQKFELKVFELNPTISFKVSDNFSVGGGIRILYSEGVVRSNQIHPEYKVAILSRDMDADTDLLFGYNLALSYKFNDNFTFAATYRSKVDLKEEGDANLFFIGSPADMIAPQRYIGPASVKLPLPADLNLALSYHKDKFGFEFVYEMLFWSEYEYLDFNYPTPLYPNYPVLYAAFDKPIPKRWDDSSAYRFGVTYDATDKLRLMAGFAIDDTPIPNETLMYELPDSDAKIYSIGFHYQFSKKLGGGIAYLYDDKEERSVNNSHLEGEFSDGGAHLIAFGLDYRF